MTYNPANAFVPNLRKPQVTVPNYKELSSNDWTYSISDNKQNYTMPDVTVQSDNYRNENEPYHNAGIRMRGMPTGEEPIYGLSKTDMNNFLNNTYNKVKGGLDVFSQTRILQPFVDDRFVYKQTFNYPSPDFLTDFVGGGELLK